MRIANQLSCVAAVMLVAGSLVAVEAVAQSKTFSQRGEVQSGQRERVTIDLLYERVRPQGEFVEIRGLGRAWKPVEVDADWRPYTDGRWIFNERVGWYFESDEPWAEITYHYGRWFDDPDEGWVWFAGVEWAPAWVEWRRSRSHVGWRPLPPRNLPRAVRNMRSRQVISIEEEWVFVPADRITEDRLVTVIVDRPRVRTVYAEARPIGRIERRGGLTVNFGLDPDILRRESQVTIRSRNLPRVEAVPVPAEVRAISTETRTTTTTDQPRRTDDSRDARRPRDAAPSSQPGETATTPQPRELREPPTDTARQPETKPGETSSPGGDRRRPAAAPTREGKTSPSDEPKTGGGPNTIGTDPERRVQPDKSRDADRMPPDRRRPQRGEATAPVQADGPPQSTRRDEPSPTAQPRRQEPARQDPREARRQWQGEPGQGPAQARSRGGDEPTGALSRPRSPGQGRDEGPRDGAREQGRERGPQQKLPRGKPE